MLLGEAQAYAAQIYCEGPNRAKVLDPEIVESVAKLLMRKTNEAEGAVRLSDARNAYYEELCKDPDLYRGYIDNVSMVIYDNLKNNDDIGYKDVRDNLAKEVLLKLFGVKY